MLHYFVSCIAVVHPEILQEHLTLDLKDESRACVSFHACSCYRKYWRERGMELNSALFGAHAQTTRPWPQQALKFGWDGSSKLELLCSFLDHLLTFI